MKKKGNGRFLLVAIGIVIVLVAGACISGTQKSGLEIKNFQIEPTEIHPEGAINVKFDVVNHDKQIISKNSFDVHLYLVEPPDCEKYWDWQKTKTIDKELGFESSYPVLFTVQSKDTIPSGGAIYTFKACCGPNATNKCIVCSEDTVTVT
ncbi:MAG: hypothetical protein JW878_00085 [Methanomicrobia archaeon]|nr:hypothetical protein [Methanomicrobia archaeon]